VFASVWQVVARGYFDTECVQFMKRSTCFGIFTHVLEMIPICYGPKVNKMSPVNGLIVWRARATGYLGSRHSLSTESAW
jgi:hypothetical protein